jgi:hypothetical protein
MASLPIHSPERLWGPHTSQHGGVSSREVWQPEREANQSISAAEFRNEWSFSSALLIRFQDTTQIDHSRLSITLGELVLERR